MPRLGLRFQIEVQLSVLVGGDALAVVRGGLFGGGLGSVVELSALAALSFGVGEDSGVGVGGFDGGASLIDGADLSMGGVGLTGPTDLPLLDRFAGLEWGLCG
jgi:hypothetical protein